MELQSKIFLKQILVEGNLIKVLTIIFVVFFLFSIFMIYIILTSEMAKNITSKYNKKEIILYLLVPFSEKIKEKVLYIVKRIIFGLELLVIAESILFVIYFTSIDIF